MWTLLARCTDEELDGVVEALDRRDLVSRGQPIGAPGMSEEFEWQWKPFVRVEHAECWVVERSGLRLPLTSITIIDRGQSMIWQTRISGPPVGFRRVEFRDANEVSAPLSKEAATRQGLEEGLGGKRLANRVCELCQVKLNAPGFGIRNIQLIAQKIRKAE
jgi:hypothetical protein